MPENIEFLYLWSAVARALSRISALVTNGCQPLYALDKLSALVIITCELLRVRFLE